MTRRALAFGRQPRSLFREFLDSFFNPYDWLFATPVILSFVLILSAANWLGDAP